MQIIANVRFTFDPADVEKAVAMFRELRDASRAEPGIVSFDVARDEEDPNAFALWEVYRDQSASDAHRSTEHFKRLVIDGVRPLAKERRAEQLTPI
jgi:quinol monooxygenase YgiN